jgi:hypothetical protein
MDHLGAFDEILGARVPGAILTARIGGNFRHPICTQQAQTTMARHYRGSKAHNRVSRWVAGCQRFLSRSLGASVLKASIVLPARWW